MRTKNSLFRLFMLLAMAVVGLGLSSCSDDDNGGGTPTITGVKILTSDTINYSYDKTYTKAGAGTMIAIMGTNLGGARQVLINGQELYINTTMNTDNSIIVTIPSEKDGFKLSAFDSNIPDQIEVVTDGGTATYAFKVTAPGPQLQRVAADYPRETGDTLRLYGLNLVDIEKMYITDASSALLDTTTWTDVPGNHTEISGYWNEKQDHKLDESTSSYQTTSVVGCLVPANAPDSGAIVLECAAGTTYVGYYRRPGKPVILSVSNDMPEIGETLVLTGREFVQVESVTYGDVTLTSKDFTVSASQDTIYLPFAKKPTAGSGMNLTVTTPGGQVTAEGNFYDYTTILTTFDGDAIDNGWGPNAEYPDAGNADGKYGWIHGTDNGSNYWGTMIYFRKDWNGHSFSLSENIPATATSKEVYLAFNVFEATDSKYNDPSFTGCFRYQIQPIGDTENCWGSFQDNTIFQAMEWDNYDEHTYILHRAVLADANGEAHKGRWYRAVVPLDYFACYNGKTYADIVKAGLNQFRIMQFNEGATKGNVDVKFDNVRVIYLPSK